MLDNAQFKCYDGMPNWNQVQPELYDGMYQFPSVTSLNPTTGKPAGSNCHMSTTAEPWGCVPNPDATDPYRSGAPMLPAVKYVVEMIVPRMPGCALSLWRRRSSRTPVWDPRFNTLSNIGRSLPFSCVKLGPHWTITLSVPRRKLFCIERIRYLIRPGMAPRWGTCS